MVTQARVIDQEVESKSTLIEPITETLQVALVAKIYRACKHLERGILRFKFRLQCLQAIVAAGYQNHLRRYGSKLARELGAKPRGSTSNQNRATGEKADAHKCANAHGTDGRRELKIDCREFTMPRATDAKDATDSKLRAPVGSE